MMADVEGTSSAEASTSRSHANSSRGYQVFLNFRGTDSRDTVVDVLRKDLAGFRVFYDDESIRKGETVEGEIMEAISSSEIYITIFSKDYASSKWCLRELAKIIDCWKDSHKPEEKKKTILPIFFHVDVSTDVKLRSELYTTALQNHKGVGIYEIKRWGDALKTAAMIKGWDIHTHKVVELCKLIKKEVCSKLWTTSSNADNFVGLDDPTEDIMELLDLDAQGVRFVVIHGMSGMGKSTLADLVSDKISPYFEPWVAFCPRIREKPRTEGSILDMQRNILLQILGVDLGSLFRNSIDGVNVIKNRLSPLKVFIVLDDIDNSSQLLKLAGDPSWFGTGSRIIITTRNAGIMSDPTIKGVYRYKMPEMETADAVKLFSRQVFGSDLPREGYEEISREAVEKMWRNRQAILAIPSLLIGKPIDEWKSIIEEVKEMVPKEVRDTLIIIYQELDNHEQEIFLDIACLFINMEKEVAFYYWEVQNLYPWSGVTVLENMHLMEIVDGNKLSMHCLHRQVGRNLADGKEKPRSKRLWSPEVALKEVLKEKGTEEVVALKLGKLDANCNFNHKQFARLTNLKFLQLSGGNFESEDFKETFSELIWLYWVDCPGRFGATNFCFEKLLILMLSMTSITDDWGLWGEIKAAANDMKVLKCTYCHFPTKSPDFSAFPRLERLIFENCQSLRGRDDSGKLDTPSQSLREIDDSIGELDNLTHFEITNTPTNPKMTRNEYYTHQLKLPDSICNLTSLKVLKLKWVNIPELPNAIGDLDQLTNLCLWCPLLGELPESVGQLKSLAELDISYTTISRLPESARNLELKVFKHEGCIGEFPDNI